MTRIIIHAVSEAYNFMRHPFNRVRDAYRQRQEKQAQAQRQAYEEQHPENTIPRLESFGAIDVLQISDEAYEAQRQSEQEQTQRQSLDRELDIRPGGLGVIERPLVPILKKNK